MSGPMEMSGTNEVVIRLSKVSGSEYDKIHRAATIDKQCVRDWCVTVLLAYADAVLEGEQDERVSSDVTAHDG